MFTNAIFLGEEYETEAAHVVSDLHEETVCQTSAQLRVAHQVQFVVFGYLNSVKRFDMVRAPRGPKLCYIDLRIF